jgi:pimeloyl-ACP methyl ester carboxylesterase
MALLAGYEVHAFDHLAHGRSQGNLSGLPIALETLLTMAAHVQKTTGPIDLLVGHSLGGGADLAVHRSRLGGCASQAALRVCRG